MPNMEVANAICMIWVFSYFFNNMPVPSPFLKRIFFPSMSIFQKCCYGAFKSHLQTNICALRKTIMPTDGNNLFRKKEAICCFQDIFWKCVCVCKSNTSAQMVHGTVWFHRYSYACDYCRAGMPTDHKTTRPVGLRGSAPILPLMFIFPSPLHF